jgi:hypothetical protein
LSSGLFPALRLLVGVAGAILLALALAALLTGSPAFISLLVTGVVALVASLWERTRYRSLAAERHDQAPGPGGGEPEAPLEPRFTRTEEVFVDPTTRRVMRVYVDRASGERRYRAESPSEAQRQG